MKLISGLISLVVLVAIAVVCVNIFFNVNYKTAAYDILIYSKNEMPKKYLGIRYKDDIMLHYFEKKSAGDSIGQMVDEWQRKRAYDESQKKL
jgi:hypothetical protein